MTYQIASEPGRDVRARRVLLDAEHLEAAELEHQDAHQEQGEQRAAGAVLDEAAADVLDAVGAKQPEDPHEAEDTQDLQLLERAGWRAGRPSRTGGRSTRTSTRP